MTGPAQDDRHLPDVDGVDVPGWRIMVAGLSVAAATMLIAIMLMVLVLRTPEIVLIAAPLVVLFVLTAGVPVSWVTWRLVRGMRQVPASVVFFVVGGVAGALWGYPIFLFLNDWLASVTGQQLSAALPWLGAAYTASTAGMGGFLGRFVGPWAATRPALVRMCAGAVLVVAVMGIAILTLVDLT